MSVAEEGVEKFSPFIVQEDDDLRSLFDDDLYEALIDTVGFRTNYSYRFVLNNSIPMEQYEAQRGLILARRKEIEAEYIKYGWAKIQHIFVNLYTDQTIYRYDGTPSVLIIEGSPAKTVEVYDEIAGAYGRSYYIDQNGKRHNAQYSLYGEIPYSEKNKAELDAQLCELEKLRADYMENSAICAPVVGYEVFDIGSKAEFAERFGERCDIFKVVNYKEYGEAVQAKDIKIERYTIVSVSRDKYRDDNGNIVEGRIGGRLYVVPDNFDEVEARKSAVKRINRSTRADSIYNAAIANLEATARRFIIEQRNKGNIVHPIKNKILPLNREQY